MKKFLLTSNKNVSSKFDEAICNRTFGSWQLWTDNPGKVVENNKYLGLVEGYLRDLKVASSDLKNEVDIFPKIENEWPLSGNITGSFAVTLLNKTSGHLLICNDVIGVYPLYYLIEGRNVYISNSLIYIGIATQTPLDEAGVAQRCLGPEFSNIGSRTILKNCKRLLPGELLKFNYQGEIIQRTFDNTLFQINFEKAIEENSYEIWNILKQEVECSLKGYDQALLALSGGLDSRLLLGSISPNIDLKCITYGAKENYETRIASRLAKIKGSTFQNFSDLNLYFPEKPLLSKYVKNSEAVTYLAWFEVLENLNEPCTRPILLGDMTEVLNGRNIKSFSSRAYKKSTFVKHHLKKENYPFTKATKKAFDLWKSEVISNHLRWYKDHKLAQLSVRADKDELRKFTEENLNEIFERIEAHNLPFVELYDELFSWITHSRIPMGKQILVCNSKFPSFSPTMSLNFLRQASKIHPDQRLGSRLMNKLFNEIPELRKLNIPTNQAPLVNQNTPDLIKFPIWGLRNKVDQILIKQMVRKKNPSGKYRLFKSLNWAEVYQNPDMIKNLESYFDNNYLGEGMKLEILNQAKGRKIMKYWPFANIDLITLSALNLEIEQLKEQKITTD